MTTIAVFPPTTQTEKDAYAMSVQFHRAKAFLERQQVEATTALRFNAAGKVIPARRGRIDRRQLQPGDGLPVCAGSATARV